MRKTSWARLFGVLAVLVLVAGCRTGQATGTPPTPGAEPAAQTPAGPASTGTAPAAETRAAGSTAGPLLDMHEVKLYAGDPVTIPYRKGGCPAATVGFTPAKPTVVNGVEYYVYGEGVIVAGDVNQDGRDEAVLLVSCSVGGHGYSTLVVVAATGPSSYATIAAGPMPAGVGGLLVQGRTIIVYPNGYDPVQGNELGRYRITNGNQITRVPK
jgi:hypothetical protein